MKEIFELFKRGVEALEKIAEMGIKATEAQPAADTNEVSAQTAADTDEVSVQLAYEDMGLDELKAECASRGLEVPKGTRATTLVKKLQENDAVKADINVAVNDERPEDVDPGPSDQKEPAVDDIEVDPVEIPDPFSEDDADQIWTPDEVRMTLQHWWSDKIGVDKGHKDYKPKFAAATKALCEFLAPYGCKKPAEIDDATGIKIMTDNEDLRGIYDSRVKGEI